MKTKPTPEARIWASLSHLSALAFGMGIALPVIGWSDQRRKSNYALFQCLQALGYQSLGFTVWALSSLLAIVVTAVVLLARLSAAAPGSGRSLEALRPGAIAGVVVLAGLSALYCFLPILAAILSGLGRDFRYPILGDRLARYLEYDPDQNPQEQAWLPADHEARWVAAMAHFSILILLWGMLAPLTAWILQGRQNRFLQFQSAQTLGYHILTTLLYLIGGFLYLAGFLMLILGVNVLGTPSPDSSAGLPLLLGIGLLLLLAFVLILFVPLLHILGQWAGYRVLKGENYRYPWVGRLTERWLEQKQASRTISQD